MSFVHCRVQSDYSFGFGASKVKDLFKRAADLGQPALALMDQDAMNGVLKAGKYGNEFGVQPIVGAKLFVPLSPKSTTRCSILAFAQSEVGYANICRMLQLQVDPMGTRPGLLGRDLMQLIERSRSTEDDLTRDVALAVGTGADSAVGMMMAASGDEAGYGFLLWLRSRFGSRCYAEVCRNGYETREEVEREARFVAWADAKGIPLLATTEVMYATPDRHDSYTILNAIREKRKDAVKGDESGIDDNGPRRYHLRSSEEMASMFRDLPDAVSNTMDLAIRSPFWPSKRKPILPTFQTEGGRSEAEELRVQARSGLERRLAGLDLSNERRAAYFDRLEFELGVIEMMKFPGYFLIVSDFIKWAKGQDIPVGPGRGSGAGSLVAYSLTITDIDPLPFGLLFERFLNPERVSMPDFDIDFCEMRRGEVIGYVQRKYGADRVGRIMTHIEYKPKGGWRDVAKVLSHNEVGGIPQIKINQISKFVPPPVQGKEAPIEVVMAVEEIASEIAKDKAVALAFEKNVGIQGVFKNPGVHPAGIVIGNVELSKLVPMGYDEQKNPATMLDMKDAEEVGLVKFDFLGLTTLSVIQMALRYVKEIKGVDVDLSKVSLADGPTLDLFAKGRTTGIFQFESEGMKAALRSIKADRIEDLIAVNALYRPGPMDMIPVYAACKNGLQDPEYPEPVEKTKPYLQETFGVMVYQEQIMQVAQVVAGLTLGGADMLRRAIGKKDHVAMAKQKQIFIDGAVEQGSDARTAEKLFALIHKFADYGFNKSHAAAYSVVAFHTAWIKAHHPECFFAALLSFVDKKEKYDPIVRDMVDFGVKLLPPDINKSDGVFRPEPMDDGAYGVRFGFKGVGGVTVEVAAKVTEQRGTQGFKDLIGFNRLCQGYFNSGQLQSLCAVGTFDSINPPPQGNRHQSFEILQFLSKNTRKDTGVADMFGDAPPIVIRPEILKTKEWTNIQDLEKEAVGFYIDTHPLDLFKDRLRELGVRTKADYDAMVRDGRPMEDVQGHIQALVEHASHEQSKYGSYVKLVLADRDSTFHVSLFPPRNGDAKAKLAASPERVLNIAHGSKTDKNPIIVSVKVMRSKDGQRAYLNATGIEYVTDFIARKGLVRYRVLYDISSDPVCGTFGFKKAEQAMRLRIAAGEDPKVCLHELLKFVTPVLNQQFKEMEKNAGAVLEHGDDVGESDILEVNFQVTIGGGNPQTGQNIIQPFPKFRFKGKETVESIFQSFGGVQRIDVISDETPS